MNGYVVLLTAYANEKIESEILYISLNKELAKKFYQEFTTNYRKVGEKTYKLFKTYVGTIESNIDKIFSADRVNVICGLDKCILELQYMSKIIIVISLSEVKVAFS